MNFLYAVEGVKRIWHLQQKFHRIFILIAANLYHAKSYNIGELWKRGLHQNYHWILENMIELQLIQKTRLLLHEICFISKTVLLLVSLKQLINIIFFITIKRNKIILSRKLFYRFQSKSTIRGKQYTFLNFKKINIMFKEILFLIDFLFITNILNFTTRRML